MNAFLSLHVLNKMCVILCANCKLWRFPRHWLNDYDVSTISTQYLSTFALPCLSLLNSDWSSKLSIPANIPKAMCAPALCTIEIEALRG